MDLWNKARVFAEETAKKSQEISIEAAKKSQDLFLTKGIGAAKDLFSNEFITEASKKSMELAVEASKKAEKLKIEALKGADRIKTLAGDIEFSIPISKIAVVGEGEEKESEEELNRFGVTKEIREFVNGITISTFRDFTMEDEPAKITDEPAVSNVRQDLNEWQARHATLVLSMVKEISSFRYELCPRYMKERKFWKIYFILVKNYVAPYEKMYFESKEKLTQKEKEVNVKEVEETKADASITNITPKDNKLETSSSNAEQDLDAFLLGDLGSSDDELGDNKNTDVDADDF